MNGLPIPINLPLPHIREYRDEDAEELARLWRESISAWPGGGPFGGEHSTAARVRQDQRDLNTLATFVAHLPDEVGGNTRAVGYCSLFEHPGEPSTAYIGILSAHPDWHGRGVGRDLLRAGLQRTVELGYERLDLNTWAGNLKAVPLYKKTGYFWAPDTSVQMENYLPLIFRQPAAQSFFRSADWYRDFVRDLSVTPDEERRGRLDVYTYRWERDGRWLSVVVDRRARSIVEIDTDRYGAGLDVDDPYIPIGGRRTAEWRVVNRGDRPLAVSLLAEGEDAVRCALGVSAVVADAAVWTAPVSAEQPVTAARRAGPANRVRSTVVIDGDPVHLAAGMEVIQALSVGFDNRARWLVPGVTRTAWLTLDNRLEATARGALSIAASSGLDVEPRAIDFEIGPRARASHRLTLHARRAGTYSLRAQARVSLSGERSPASGGEDPLRTKVFEQTVHCASPGAIFVEQTDERVVLAGDRLVVSIPLKATGDWSVRFSIAERESGDALGRHACSLGPPFVPSVFATCDWTPRVDRTDGAPTVVLTTTPPSLPGLTFERRITLSQSGIVEAGYAAINVGTVPRTLQLSAETSASFEAPGGTQVAAPLVAGLVVDDSTRFPDWDEPDMTRPERYAETWLAESGDGRVMATIWRGASAVAASWSAPDLTFDLPAIEPGGRVDVPPIYLYAGLGDWRTARSLWRQLVAPDAPAEHPTPRRAHRAVLERFVAESDALETHIRLDSERRRPISGDVRLEVAGAIAATGTIHGLGLGRPASVEVRAPLPAPAAAVPAAIVLDHERTTERFETALVRIGRAGAGVKVDARMVGQHEIVTVDNGRIRLGIIPAQMARVAEMSVRGPAGEWQNQLHSPGASPGVWVWFNPWYGGIHPSLYTTSRYPGDLARERFGWRETERTGSQGVRWRGVVASALTSDNRPTGLKLAAGLRLDVSYLTCGESNVLATTLRLANESHARTDGSLWMHSFVQPGGDRSTVVLHYERDGIRTSKRVHGGFWGSSERWCAVAAGAGSPVIAVIVATPGGRIDELRDMGFDGVHPAVRYPLRLAPGEAYEAVTYYAVADDIEQALLYRHLAGSGELV